MGAQPRGGDWPSPAPARPAPPARDQLEQEKRWGGEANPSAHKPSAGGPGRRGEPRASQVEAQVFKGRK